jgi:hypothetical protein
MADTGNPLDDLVTALVEKIDKTIGELVPEQHKPFASQPLTRAEQLEKYMVVRGDPAAWVKILDEQGLRPTIQYALAMEGLLKTETPGKPQQ